MWLSSDGRAVSNAWGDPTGALPNTVLELIESLSSTERHAMGDSLRELSMSMFEGIDEFAATTTAAIEADFRKQWLPLEVIEGFRSRTVTELKRELAEVPFRWRLDACLLVEQYIEEVDTD